MNGQLKIKPAETDAVMDDVRSALNSDTDVNDDYDGDGDNVNVNDIGQ